MNLTTRPPRFDRFCSVKNQKIKQDLALWKVLLTETTYFYFHFTWNVVIEWISNNIFLLFFSLNIFLFAKYNKWGSDTSFSNLWSLLPIVVFYFHFTWSVGIKWILNNIFLLSLYMKCCYCMNLKQQISTFTFNEVLLLNETTYFYFHFTGSIAKTLLFTNTIKSHHIFFDSLRKGIKRKKWRETD